MCVAGYAFEKRSARLLAKEWRTVLARYQLPFFHMVDCAHGNEHFAQLTRQQRIKIATSLIGITKRRAACGFVVSVDLKAYQEVMPDWGPTKSPYAFCARCVIDEMGKWFFRTNFRGKSSYFFEAGHKSRSEAEEVVSAVLTNPLNEFNGLHYGYAAHSFVSKQDAPSVQAADVLAWQWTTDVKHQMTGRPRRKDFESLLEIPTRGTHFDHQRLQFYVEVLKEFGVSGEIESETTFQHAMRLLYIRQRARPYMYL